MALVFTGSGYDAFYDYDNARRLRICMWIVEAPRDSRTKCMIAAFACLEGKS